MIDINLTSKAISEPIRYNAYYKLVIMLAIIKYCSNGQKATIQLIHLVFWSLRTEENYKVLFDFSKEERQTITPWSFEEDIDKILSLAYINHYCDKSISKDGLEVKLSTLGEEILKKVNDFELFQEDLIKIKKLGKLPKTKIANINKRWSLI